jgi:hypothetical protein
MDRTVLEAEPRWQPVIKMERRQSHAFRKQWAVWAANQGRPYSAEKREPAHTRLCGELQARMSSRSIGELGSLHLIPQARPTFRGLIVSVGIDFCSDDSARPCCGDLRRLLPSAQGRWGPSKLLNLRQALRSPSCHTKLCKSGPAQHGPAGLGARATGADFDRAVAAR